MQRSPGKASRQSPSCPCLVDAFRKFPAEVDIGAGCASPDCLVKSLDSITLRQFLEAIGGPDDVGDDDGTGRAEVAMFGALEKRLRRRKSSRPPE